MCVYSLHIKNVTHNRETNMNRDDIACSIPSYENEADRYAMDESPLVLGELGAGLGLGEPTPRPKKVTEIDPRFPNGCLTVLTEGTRCGYGHACLPA